MANRPDRLSIIDEHPVLDAEQKELLAGALREAHGQSSKAILGPGDFNDRRYILRVSDTSGRAFFEVFDAGGMDESAKVDLLDKLGYATKAEKCRRISDNCVKCPNRKIICLIKRVSN